MAVAALSFAPGALAAFPLTGGQPVAGPDGASSVARADLNGDGIQDLVTVSTPANAINVFLGQPGGHFVPGQHIVTPNAPEVGRLADVDGDGRIDLVVPTQFAGTWVYWGIGDGTFMTAAQQLPGNVSGNEDVGLADFNHDGHIDVAILNDVSDTLSFDFQFGTRAFTPAGATLPSSGSRMRVFDLNKDGLPDIVVANHGANQVSTWTGQLDGNFHGQTLVTGNGPRDVTIADFNGDGIPDLAVLDDLAPQIDLYSGSVSGLDVLFQPAGQVTSPANAATSIASADLDHDGRPDLAISDANAGVFLFQNLGSSEFGAPQNLPGGANTRMVITNDLTSDGLPDVTAAAEGSGLRIYFGLKTAGATASLVSPPAVVNTATPAFSFTSDVLPATFKCSVDGGTAANCASPFTTPSLADGSHTFGVQAFDSTSASNGPVTWSFTVSASGGGSPPANTAVPSVAATRFAVGFLLSADDGSWSGAPTAFAEQWQISHDVGDTWTPIAGATSLNYRVHVSDAGADLRLAVTATNANGSTVVTSPALPIPALPANGALAWTQFNAGTGQYEVWGANPGGTPIPLFAAVAFENKQPSFSPDGQMLAFTSAQTILPGGGHQDAIVTMPADGGSAPLVLAGDAVGDQWPEWSPDGTTIAYIETDAGGGDGTGSLWLAPAPPASTFAAHVLLQSNIEQNFTMPAWSPDGATIAVVEEQAPGSPFTGASTIDLVDAGTGLITHLIGPTPGLKHPHFNADGTILYYDVDTSGSAAALHAYNLETASDSIVASGGFDRQGVPSPDGAALAWLHDANVITGSLSGVVGATVSSAGADADPAWGTGVLPGPAAPDTKLVSGPTFAAPLGSGTVDLQFSAVGSPSATVNCFVNGEGVGACPTSFDLNVGETNTVEAQAVDGSVFDSTPITLNIFVPAAQGNGDIAFESDQRTAPGNEDVYFTHPDGTGLTAFAGNSTAFDGEPSYSPDGSQIAFSSNRTGTADIYIANVDGSSLRQLTHGAGASYPAWSPDGQTIAYTAASPTGPDRGIWTVRADGTGSATFLGSSTPGANIIDFGPRWSPDGRFIVFTEGGALIGHTVWNVDVATHDVTELRSVDALDPSYSPANDKIVFASAFGGGVQQIWTMNTDGSNPAQLTTADTSYGLFYPSYSPDGTKIVYSQQDDGTSSYLLHTIDADGTHDSGPLNYGIHGNADDFPVWGSAPPSTVTSLTASISGATHVAMAGANDSVASIPLQAFAATPPGVSPAPINNLPINNLAAGGLPINNLPINNLPINNLPINNLPINNLPINNLPINNLPINNLPINNLGGWAAILQGTTLAGLPLQTVTLQEVLAVSSPADAVARIRNLKLGDLAVANSALGRVTVGALALGATPINNLGLTIDQVSELTDWCSTAVIATTDSSGSPTTTACDVTSVPTSSLFELALEGAPINNLPINNLPINNLPINNLPINNLPINNLDTSASPINNLPINNLPINNLPINNLSLDQVLANQLSGQSPSFGDIHISALTNKAGVVDCTVASLVCGADTLGRAHALGAIKSTATVGDLAGNFGALTLGDLHFYGALTIGDLLPLLPGNTTLGDVLALLVKRADVPWETLSPALLALFDNHRPEASMSVAFHLTAPTSPVPATVEVTLPDGFAYKPGSSQLSNGGTAAVPIADPAVSGQNVTWTIPDADTGDTDTVTFSVYSGTTIGDQQATAKVKSGSASDIASAGIAVDDSFEPNDSGAAAQQLQPDTGVQQSAISSGGDVDYYKIPLPPAGDRINVHLTNLHADYDLALYAQQTTSVRTAANTGAALQDGTVADQSIDLNGGPNAQLTPTALQDVPDPGIPVVQVSANRGTDDEDVGMVSPGGSGFATIAVFGYNGASSPLPYSLRVTTTPAQTTTCPVRQFGHAGEGTAGSPTAIPSDLNTVFLVDEKRLGDTYGLTAETNVDTALRRLAGERTLGISGAVIPVESLSGVQTLYNQWDANPCNNLAANNVANAIADQIQTLKALHPTLKYVVFTGGDDQVPYFRTPDTERIANESGFASSFGRNEYYGALTEGNLLSDNPYLDTRPIPAGGRQLFIPDLAGGRLVETADEIVTDVTDFESSHGQLDNSSAFVSGYDFVTDGATQVASNLAAATGVTPITLISNGWSTSDLLTQAFPGGHAAAINSWNGHYDNHQALAANGDRSALLETTALNGVNALSGGIFFTMGCHAGFQTTDAIVGATSPDALDWPELFAKDGTGFVANTGFGLGNTDSIAFSEELMADFAQNLSGTYSIGDALTQAKQAYYLGRTAFSSYDEKTLSEAELYGLPMYGVGTSPVPLAAALHASAPHVRGTSGTTTSPADGSLAPLGGTSAQVAGFDVTPAFESVALQGAHGNYFTNEGQVQAPNYRPLQPFVTLSATRSLAAHGVLVDALTSHDVQHFDPDNVRPTLDLSANEPEPQFADEAWPEKVPTLVSLKDSSGLRQSLNLTTGQFFTDAATHDGTERQWTHITGRVTYSASNDFVQPTIDSIDAFIVNGVVTFTGHFSDLTETGAPGSVKLAQVVYDVDNLGHWQSLPLQFDSSTHLWTGGAAFTGTNVQFFVEACDDAGNCGFSSNKGRYYDAQPVPAATGTLTLAPRTSPNAAGFYTGTVDVDAADPAAGAIELSVDGGPYVSETTAEVTGDGSHTVDARASDGSVAHTAVLIDGSAPTAVIAVDPASIRQNYPAHFTVTCSDRGSGVKTCAADQDGTPRQSGDALNTTGTSTTIHVHVTDNAGNSDVITKVVPILADSPPTTPGTPTASSTPNRGQFTITWPASTDPEGDPITYSVSHKRSTGSAYTTVATGITATSYSFVTPPELEGSWTYKISASDGTLSSALSAASAAVIVDQTPPVVTITCPAQPVLLNAVATASWTASDAGSGIHGPTSGTVALVTSAVGPRTASITVTDNVGFSTTATCSYSVIWPFTGFSAPVDNPPVLNVIKPGQAVPVKFGLGGDRGLAIFAAGYPAMETISCASSAPLDVIEQTVTAGNSSLQYDSGAQQYSYVWKTPSSGWPSGACRQLILKLVDGTTHIANFKAK